EREASTLVFHHSGDDAFQVAGAAHVGGEERVGIVHATNATHPLVHHERAAGDDVAGLGPVITEFVDDFLRNGAHHPHRGHALEVTSRELQGHLNGGVVEGRRSDLVEISFGEVI